MILEPLFESSVSATAAVCCILQDDKHYAWGLAIQTSRILAVQ